MWEKGFTAASVGRLIFQSSLQFHRHASTSKYLKRLLDGDKKKKKKHFNPGTSTTTTGKYVSEERKMRFFRVSQVIYENVVDLVDSGELDPYIPTLGISISEVVWSPEMNSISIYWKTDSDDTEKRDTVRNLLNSKAKKLRALLISRKISGHIPNVQFVWDKSQLRYSHLEYIDKMLSVADYGPDYELQKYSRTRMHQELPILQTSPRLLEKLQKINEEKDPVAMNKVIMKSFRDDVYGLDHTLLVNSIKESKQKLKSGLKKREKKLMKSQKEFNSKGAGTDIGHQEETSLVDLVTRTKGLPVRVADMQKSLLEDGECENLKESDEPNFFEDEWSDDEEDFDNEDEELRITCHKSTEHENGDVANLDVKNLNYTQLEDPDHNEKGSVEVDSKQKTSIQRLRIGKRLGSSTIHSPLRVRDMQSLLTDESAIDGEIDLLEDEWSDDEAKEVTKESDIPRDEKHR
ncbi:uncharacterized protein LOC125648379 [Ostrea edulis]|uniref:uncharacterized protein LOC125648379 n=1 Tax=Ostrea edulis TaxID=37623 RepID=UPI0024AF6B5D|nr:uncharacterized protein LOC125648379 [Ostrea edulis]XP_048731382.2 uncharacterized protein LOC125648379 [Ostrea edulis]